jgi:hypothetical protein
LHHRQRNRYHFDAFPDKHRKLARRDAGFDFWLRISLASGLFFLHPTHPAVPLSKILSVRMFLWRPFNIVTLFAVAWFLEVYNMPLTRPLFT